MEILHKLLVARSAQGLHRFARYAEAARSADNPHDTPSRSAQHRRAGAGGVATRSADPDAGSGAEDRADSGFIAVDFDDPKCTRITEAECARGETEDAGGDGNDGGIELAAVVRADLEA